MKAAHWDGRYLGLAAHVASWSKDPSTQTGAVIVDPLGHVSLGFNGFPRGMSDAPELYADRVQKLPRVIHAEINALLFAGHNARGATLYTYPFPCCDRCFVQMIQAGVVRFVAPVPTAEQCERWGDAFERVFSWAKELGVTYDLRDR